MTPAERLIAQVKAQRLRWVELVPASGEVPAKRVQITRPPENDVAGFIATSTDGRLTLEAGSEHVSKYVLGWDGITEADLVGAAGSSDPAPFTPALWALVVEDKLAWMRAIARALLDAIVEHQSAQKEDAKN